MNENESGTNPQITSDDFNPIKLIIDPEFKNLIPPLDPQEYRELEGLILKDGCRDPIVVWKGMNIIVDGHNRFEICSKHNIKFKIIEKEFQDRESVKRWIKKNQRARRNLTKAGKTYLMGKDYESQKKSIGGDRRNQYRTLTVEMAEIAEQYDNLSEVENQLMLQGPEMGSTAEKIAEIYNVCEFTVKRAEQYSNAVDILEENIPSTKSKILSGEIDISIKDTLKLAQEDLETQKKIIARLQADPDKTKAKKLEKPEKSPEQINAEMLAELRKQISELNDEDFEYICQEIAEEREKRNINSAYELAGESASPSALVIASNEVETKHEPEEQL